MPGEVAAAAPALPRVIGFWGGAALVVGMTIGSGIFRKPPTIAGLVPDAPLVLGLWIAFGAISLCGALTLAELASMLPRTGGLYVYLRAAFGDGAAFVFGWLYTLVTAPAAVGALALVFVEFLLGAAAIPPAAIAPPLAQGAAILTIVLLAGVAVAGTRLATGLQAGLTAIKVAALVALILAAFLAGQGSLDNLASRAGPVERGNFARAIASVIWTYDGWMAVSTVAGEVLAPERLLRRIIVAGIAAIVLLYLAANVAYFYVMPVGDLAKEGAGIAARIMEGALGPWGGHVIALCISASVLGTLQGNILSKPRVAYAMAHDGLTFRALGRLSARLGTPGVAIGVQTAVAVLLVVCLRDFDRLSTYFVVVEWSALLFAVGAVFVLRRTMPDAPRPFRVPGYPLVPLVFVVGTLVGLGAIVWGEWRGGNRSPVWGLAIAAAGFPVHALLARRMRAAAA